MKLSYMRKAKCFIILTEFSWTKQNKHIKFKHDNNSWPFTTVTCNQTKHQRNDRKTTIQKHKTTDPRNQNWQNKVKNSKSPFGIQEKEQVQKRKLN